MKPSFDRAEFNLACDRAMETITETIELLNHHREIFELKYGMYLEQPSNLTREKAGTDNVDKTCK